MQEKRSVEESFKVFRVISKLLLEGREKNGGMSGVNTIK